MSQEAITFSDVAFSYRSRPLLQGVNLSIQQGEFIGIIGPNGSGKTTLLKLMMGLMEPTLGTIWRDHVPVGYVPQGLRFDRKFPISVFELVLSGRLSHLPWYGRYGHADKEAAEEALIQVGMESYKQKSFGTLSGGEAQRALMARALAARPKLLFLDEPTSNVDLEAERQIYSILDTLKGDITIVMVTHSLKTTIEHVERVLTVEKEVQSFKPKDICGHFAMGLYHPPLIEKEEP